MVVRAAEETEEYQRVSTNVGKGLAVIQEELSRMRITTKARVDSLNIQREVRSHSATFHQERCSVVFNYVLICLISVPAKTTVRFDLITSSIKVVVRQFEVKFLSRLMSVSIKSNHSSHHTHADDTRLHISKNEIYCIVHVLADDAHQVNKCLSLIGPSVNVS